jgi:hypothetical protein
MNKLYTILIFSLFSGSTLVTPKGNFKTKVINSPKINKSNEVDTLIYTTDNFKFAEKAFKFYTKKVDTSIITQLIKVSDYYGLNDMWKGNWFQARRDDLGEKGMKQLDDGSYVADFDELPKLTTQEIKDSFNSY